MKRGIRPIAYPGNKTVLDRVVMDIIHVRPQIIFIAHGMFPKSPLPHVIFTLGILFDRRARLLQSPRETGFDQAPAVRIICVARRQRPNAMQVLRQDNNGVDVKRACAPCEPKRLAQQIYVPDEPITPTVGECNSEKIRSAGYKIAAIQNHARACTTNGAPLSSIQPRIPFHSIRATQLL
jgi:hypothetical protein